MARGGQRDTDRPADPEPLAGIALRLLTALLLAIMFALVKLASTRGVNVVESLFYRQCGTALCATGYVAVGPGFDSLRTQRVWAHIGRMALGVGAMGLNFLAFILLPLAEATTIGFSVPIFAVILAALVLDEPTGKWRWGAVAAGFAGVLLIVQPGSGVVPLLGASVALAFSFVWHALRAEEPFLPLPLDREGPVHMRGHHREMAAVGQREAGDDVRRALLAVGIRWTVGSAHFPVERNFRIEPQIGPLAALAAYRIGIFRLHPSVTRIECKAGHFRTLICVFL